MDILRLVLTFGGDDDVSLLSSSCDAEVLLRLRLVVTSSTCSGSLGIPAVQNYCNYC